MKESGYLVFHLVRNYRDKFENTGLEGLNPSLYTLLFTKWHTGLPVASGKLLAYLYIAIKY